MHAFSRIVAASCLTLLTVSPSWSADAIRWETDFETAMQKAAQQNRLLLVHFWGDGCVPCQAVEKNVFPNAQVSRAVHDNYIAVKVHAQQRPDLVQRFDVQAWPTDVMLTPAGRKVAQYISPQEPARYAQMVQEVAAREQSHGFGAPAGTFAQSRPSGAVGMGDQASAFPLAGGSTLPTAYQNPNGGGDFPVRANAGFPSPAPQQDYAGAFRGGQNVQPPFPPQTAQAQPPYAPGLPAAAPAGSNSPYGGRESAFPGASMNNQAGFAANNPIPNARPPMNAAAPMAGAINNPFTAPQVSGGPQNGPLGQPEIGQAVSPGPPTHPQVAHNFPSAPAANPPSSAPQNAPAAPAGPPLAMDGHCVVSLVDQLHLPADQWKWKKGDARWGAVHRGRTYLFAGPGEQQRFLANPDYYTPVLSGHDPVAFSEQGRLVDGRREFGLTYQGKIYLFASEPNLQRFWASPGAYINRVQQAMNTSPSQQPPR